MRHTWNGSSFVHYLNQCGEMLIRPWLFLNFIKTYLKQGDFPFCPWGYRPAASLQHLWWTGLWILLPKYVYANNLFGIFTIFLVHVLVTMGLLEYTISRQNSNRKKILFAQDIHLIKNSFRILFTVRGSITAMFCVKSANHWANENTLTHWGRVTHICVSKLTTIGSNNGLSPGRCQAIIWTNGAILFSDILFEIHTYSLKNALEMSSGNWRPFCLRLKVLSGNKISRV